MSGHRGCGTGSAGIPAIAAHRIHAADRYSGEPLSVLCSMGEWDPVCGNYLPAPSGFRILTGAFARIADGGSGVFGKSGVLRCSTAEKTVEALCVCAIAESGNAVVLYGYRVQPVPAATAGKVSAAGFHGDSPVDNGAAGCYCCCVFVETVAEERKHIVKNPLTNRNTNDNIVLFRFLRAAVAELADALDSKSSAFAGVPVRLRPAAPNSNKCEKIILMGWSFFVQQKEKLYGHVTGRTALWITCSKIFCGCNAKITGAYGIIQYISL